MPLGEKRVPPARTPESGRLAKFLLSPHFTGILLPSVIMVVGAIYHLTTIWQHQQIEKKLREEIRVLRQEKETFESRLKSLEGEVQELQRKAASKSEKSAQLSPASPALDEMLTFFPSKYPVGNWKPRDLAFEDVAFAAADGVKLHGWYVKHAAPRGAVLYCHGNGGNVSFDAELLKFLHDRLSVSVLEFDYRGYGKSEGNPTVEGALLDARAARAVLAQKEGLKPEQIVLMGRSLGGAIAVDLAKDGARGLILESTFTSLRETAAVHYPAPLVALLVPSRLESLTAMANYRGPLLISHGNVDETVPFAHGEKLFGAALGPKIFVTIFGGSHNSPQSAEYYEKLDAFLKSLPPVGSQ
jgi:fermentation-respiration switch protein FrsA (DUF1100 family)